MKKLLLAILSLGVASLHGQNPTLVYGTNGIRTYPATTHAGKVTVGLDTNLVGFTTGAVPQWNGSAMIWTTNFGGGSATPGGSSGDIQFNNAGALGGSNAFRINFSGLNARVSNAAGGMIEFVAPTTNINAYARRAIFGPTNTTPTDIYTDFYIKGQKSDFSAFTFDGPAATPLSRFYVQHYNSSLGGIEISAGRLSGGVGLNIFVDVNATSPILYKNVGASDLQFAVVEGNKISFGNYIGTTLNQEYAYYTNDAMVINKQVILPQRTLTYSGTNIAWNVTNSPNAFVVLTNNARLGITGYYPGGSYQLTTIASVNGAGLSFTNIIKWTGGTSPTITSNGVDLLNFTAYSTNAATTNIAGTYLQNLQ